MSGKIADLYADVGFKFDQVKLREVSKYIGDINIASIISATSLTALGLGIKELVEQTSTLSNNLNILATTTGIDPQFIQQIEHAALVLGSSKQAADSWISSLSSLQQKLRVAQGDQRFFTAAQMLGVDPVSFQKIIGSTEELAPAVIKILSKVNKETDRAKFENIQRTKTWLASMINIPPDLLTAFENRDFLKIANSFQGISNADIGEANASMRKWRDSIDQLNTEFLKLSVVMLPLVDLMSQAIKKISDFIHAGDPRNFPKPAYEVGTARTQHNTGRVGFQSTLSEVADFNNFWGKFWAAESITSSRLHKQNRPGASGSFENGSKSVTINIAPITVHANNPEDFVKKFDDHFKKYMDLTARQFTLGQT